MILLCVTHTHVRTYVWTHILDTPLVLSLVFSPQVPSQGLQRALDWGRRVRVGAVVWCAAWGAAGSWWGSGPGSCGTSPSVHKTPWKLGSPTWCEEKTTTQTRVWTSDCEHGHVCVVCVRVCVCVCVCVSVTMCTYVHSYHYHTGTMINIPRCKPIVTTSPWCLQTTWQCCYSHQSVQGLLLVALIGYVPHITVEVAGSLAVERGRHFNAYTIRM